MVEPCTLGGAQRQPHHAAGGDHIRPDTEFSPPDAPDWIPTPIYALPLPPASPLAAFQPKLANLLFTYELQRRLMRHGSTIAVAAHPGVADTELARNSPPALRVLLPVGGSASGVD